MGERGESLMRIVVFIVTGIVLGLWKYFIFVIVIANFFYALFAGKRIKELGRLAEIWNTQYYIFLRYVTFVTNERPFPFESLTKSISKFGK